MYYNTTFWIFFKHCAGFWVFSQQTIINRLSFLSRRRMFQNSCIIRRLWCNLSVQKDVMSKFWIPQKSLILQHCELRIQISYHIAWKSPKMSQFSRRNNPIETFCSNFLTLLFWAQIWIPDEKTLLGIVWEPIAY